MRKRMAFVGAIIGTTAGIGIGRSVRTWRTWGIDPLEANKPLAGDELVPVPSAVETRSITIDAPPAAVWPWLVQMGYGRGGWYSYDQLDMRGASATKILPEHQVIAVGDIVPTSPSTGFVVREIEPGRALVLFSDTALVQSQAVAAAEDVNVSERQVPVGLAASGAFLGRSPQDFAASWAFSLEPLDDGRTRLIERFRVRFDGAGPAFRLVGPIMGIGVFVMVRRQLLGIRDRAELTAVAPAIKKAEARPSEVKPVPASTTGRSVELAPEAEIVAIGA
jgi:hypothetical protein